MLTTSQFGFVPSSLRPALGSRTKWLRFHAFVRPLHGSEDLESSGLPRLAAFEKWVRFLKSAPAHCLLRGSGTRRASFRVGYQIRGFVSLFGRREKSGEPKPMSPRPKRIESSEAHSGRFQSKDKPASGSRYRRNHVRIWGGRALRCLYCGKQYWLPSQTRRDPDFCSPVHRQEYNSRVELAMRRIGESAAPAVPKRVPEPVVQIPELRTAVGDARAVAYPRVTARSPRLVPADPPRPPRPASSEAAAVHTPAYPSSAVQPRLERPEADRLSRQVSTSPAGARTASAEFERKDQTADTADDKEPVFRGMLSMLETAAIDRHRARRFATTAIAASVAVAMVLWAATHLAHAGRDLLNWRAAKLASSPAVSIPLEIPESSTTPTAAPPAEANAFRHALDWAASAAIQRATTHLAEDFETGMAAWGRKPHEWAPGWSRSPDGYVRPGQLALYQPTLRYANYRMDFFGQIESKSLSWVVRGKDSRNYYAMELKLQKAGLRPVLSMVHYPVIDGRHGRAVELPLSVMVHNDAPYHISVEVKGSHYTASLEGEEIDSWSDDTLVTGGVGFFSETGARARIYWMRVSRNDDWFGWLCGRIAATAGTGDIARVDSPAYPTLSPERRPVARSIGVEIGIIATYS